MSVRGQEDSKGFVKIRVIFLTVFQHSADVFHFELGQGQFIKLYQRKNHTKVASGIFHYVKPQ